MTPEQERQFDKFETKYFKSQRELPPGRDFRWNSEKSPVADKKYRDNFDKIFPNNPSVGF